MADNANRTPSGSQPIRALDKGGVLTQGTVLDVGGSGAEALLSNVNPMPIIGPWDAPVRVQEDFGFDVSNGDPGQILFYGPKPGDASLSGWNDGSKPGTASIDYDLTFDSHPTILLDPQGLSTGNTTPGTSPLQTSGIVYKNRLQFPLNGKYSAECWWRWSSQNNGTNSLTTLDHYNRDGVNFWMSRIWINNTVDPMTVLYLNSAGTYTQVATVNSFPATHMYDPPNGAYDETGQWTFVKLKTDFTTKKYIYAQVNDVLIDLSGIDVYSAASTGARAMHFGVTYTGRNATARYMHIAKLIGRRYTA